MSGARAGKNNIRKFNAHLNTIFMGKNVEIAELIDPNPIKFRITPNNLEKIFARYLGIFFTTFFVLTFILFKNPLR